jgi:glycerol-3-phosphate acyltransferase PlsY
MLSGKELTFVLSSYILGCFTAGYYWVRWRTGQDLRELGSGNVGARNVGRNLGATGFTTTFLCDCFKGALAVYGARFFDLTPDAVIACLVAVVVGHAWPVQLRFHGGKGIATSLGAIFVYNHFTAMVLLVTFLPLLLVLRNFTISGMLAFALTPLIIFLCDEPPRQIAAISFLAILVLLTHRKNIREEIARFFPGHPVKDTPSQRQSDKRREDEH